MSLVPVVQRGPSALRGLRSSAVLNTKIDSPSPDVWTGLMVPTWSCAVRGHVMKVNELVWRSLADHALQGERTWSNVGDLAYDAGVPGTTAYLALERLESNGSIDRYSRGGLAVVSIDKVLTMLCAWRNLKPVSYTHLTL